MKADEGRSRKKKADEGRIRQKEEAEEARRRQKNTKKMQKEIQKKEKGYTYIFLFNADIIESIYPNFNPFKT